MEQQLQWYVAATEGQALGPLSVRDIDVMIRTGQISQRAVAWKQGLSHWRPLAETPQLAKLFGQQKEHDKEEQVDEAVQAEEVDPVILQAVDHLLQNTFRKGVNGQWNIYDQKTRSWRAQKEEPTAEMLKMRKMLLKSLRKQMKKPERPIKKIKKKDATKKKQHWYSSKVKSYIYVSGLPKKITMAQCQQFFKRAGLIRTDRLSGQPKIKLYLDDKHEPKGDAAISYARPQSVQLAIEMLSGREIMPGHVVKIEPASFKQKDDEYRPRQKQACDKNELRKIRDKEKIMLSWNDQSVSKFRTVVLKNVFGPQEMADPAEKMDLIADVTEQIQKIGKPEELHFYQSHPQGVVKITFLNQHKAAECISIMNGRYFGGRTVSCDYWDRVTRFEEVSECKEKEGQRLAAYEEWLQK